MVTGRAEAWLERCLLPGSLRRPRVNSLPAYAVKVHPFSPMRPFTSEERKFRLRALPLLYHTSQTVLSYWEDYEYLFSPPFFSLRLSVEKGRCGQDIRVVRGP